MRTIESSAPASGWQAEGADLSPFPTYVTLPFIAAASLGLWFLVFQIAHGLAEVLG